MSRDPDRVERERHDEQRDSSTEREASHRSLASGCGEHAARDREWNEQQHLVVGPAVDRARAGEREPYREPRVAPGHEARGERDAAQDDRDREHPAGCAEDLTER